MEIQITNDNRQQSTLRFNLGTFRGFNFHDDSAINWKVTGNQVLAWDEDEEGQAVFWPSGDCPGVELIFGGKSSVTNSELLDLDHLLYELGGDSTHNYLKIYFALNCRGADSNTLTAAEIENQAVMIFCGTSLFDLRRKAAYELFELYYPAAYAVWKQGTCDGLIFDTDQFLNSPALSTHEVTVGEEVALLVSPQ